MHCDNACSLCRLQKWHKKNVMVALETDEQKTRFVNFAGFMAEIYSKIEVVCIVIYNA